MCERLFIRRACFVGHLRVSALKLALIVFKAGVRVGHALFALVNVLDCGGCDRKGGSHISRRFCEGGLGKLAS